MVGQPTIEEIDTKMDSKLLAMTTEKHLNL